MSFSDVEKALLPLLGRCLICISPLQAIMDLSTRARNNQLTREDLTGGTFTISNGGK
jgi:hypothetical protein